MGWARWVAQQELEKMKGRDMNNTNTAGEALDLNKLQRFNNRGGLMNPEANGLYYRVEDVQSLLTRRSLPVDALPGCLADRLYEAISIARQRAQHAGSTQRMAKWDATTADLRAALARHSLPVDGELFSIAKRICDRWDAQVPAKEVGDEHRELRAALARAGSEAPTLTAQQIAAGAAVLGDDGKPIGRNTAIMVADAMGVGAAPTGQQAEPVAWPPSYKLKAGERIFYSALAQTSEGLPIMTDCDQHGAWDVAVVFEGSNRCPKYVWGFDDTAPVSTAPAAPTAELIANVILRLIGECVMDWKAGLNSDDPEADAFHSDAEELRVLVDLVNKALAAPTAAEGPTGLREWLMHQQRNGEDVHVRVGATNLLAVLAAAPLPTKEGAGEVDDLPPLTMAVYGTRTALDLERQRRADIAARREHVAAHDKHFYTPAQPKDTTDTRRDA